MRIWMINHYALPPTSAGGTRHYNYAQQLIERGHKVTIIAADFNHFSRTYQAHTSKPGEIDFTYAVPFLWIPTPAYAGNTVSRFWNMLSFSRRLLQRKCLPKNEKPDLIIGSSPHLFGAFAALLLARRLRVPFFFEVRDIWPDTLVELGKFTHKHPLIYLMKKIELYLYKHATRVITLLPAADQYLMASGVRAENIVCLPNAVDMQAMPIASVVEKQKHFTFMYAGAHGLANDLDTVLDAAKLLQSKECEIPIKIILLGDGPEKKRLKERVMNEHIKIIEFQDAVPKNKIHQALERADVYLMLLKRSPLFRWGISPNKLFDYLAMSRPIIFGVETPYNPVLLANAGICIEPSNASELADAMKTLASLSLPERQAMGERGRKFVAQKHDIAALSARLEQLMVEVV